MWCGRTGAQRPRACGGVQHPAMAPQEQLRGTLGHPEARSKRREGLPCRRHCQQHGGLPPAFSARKPDCDVRGRQCERAGGDPLKAVFRAQNGGLRSKELPWDYGNHLHFLASLQTRGSPLGSRRRGTSLSLRKEPHSASLSLALAMSLASLSPADYLQALCSTFGYPQSPILT